MQRSQVYLQDIVLALLLAGLFLFIAYYLIPPLYTIGYQIVSSFGFQNNLVAVISFYFLSFAGIMMFIRLFKMLFTKIKPIYTIVVSRGNQAYYRPSYYRRSLWYRFYNAIRHRQNGQNNYYYNRYPNRYYYNRYHGYYNRQYYRKPYPYKKEEYPKQ